MTSDLDNQNSQWQSFLLMISDTQPINFDVISKIIKIGKDGFPSDQVIKDYFDQVFSKTTIAANRQKWHTQDKNLLIWAIVKYLYYQHRTDLQPTSKDFTFISELLRVPQDLIVLKWISLLHTNLKQQPWSQEEDNLLKEIAKEKYKNNNWTELTIEFNQRASTQRYPKQIRERWNNVLNPNIQKQNWSREEKLKLIGLVYQYGKKWSKIQSYLQGRCENQIKNQYNGIMRNLKKLNLNLEQEKLVLKLIINNPEQKISATINDFVISLEKEEQQNKKKIQQSYIGYPTMKQQIPNPQQHNYLQINYYNPTPNLNLMPHAIPIQYGYPYYQIPQMSYPYYPYIQEKIYY